MSQIFEIRDRSYFSSVFTRLNEQRSSGTLCDFTIKVSNVSFRVHRCVLLATCDYFNTLLLGEFMEKTRCEIEMKEMCPDAMGVVLDFLYTGILRLQLENACEILYTADFLQLFWLKDQCAEYLEKNIDEENCLELFKLAVMYNCESLEKETKKMVLENLGEIMKTKSFLELSNDHIDNLLQSSTSINENTNLLALLNWVKHDETNRKPGLRLLLSHINPKHISKKFFGTHLLNEPMMEDASCSRWLLRNFNFIATNALNYGRNIFLCYSNIRRQCQFYDVVNAEYNFIADRPEVQHFYPVKYKNYICLTGGVIPATYSLGQLNYTGVLHSYDAHENRWKELFCAINGYRHVACTLNDKLYMSGGYDNMNEIKIYDMNFLRLISQTSMTTERYSHSIAVNGQRIYMCGGRDNLNSTESYDPREGGQCLRLRSMNNASGSGCLVALADDLYFTSKSSNRTERYDIRTNSWEIIENAPGNSAALVNVCEKLYCFSNDGVFSYDQIKWNLIHRGKMNPTFAIPFNF